MGVVVVLGVLGGCESDLGPFVPREWGLITLDHQMVGGSDYTRPQALFYSSLSSPTLSGRSASDVCGRFQYPSPPSLQTVDEIPAGDRVTLTVNDAQYSLVPTMIDGRRPYTLPDPGIAYRPGDSVVVDIPGATDGFPAVTIRGRTAEEFSIGPVDTELAGSPAVTWTPAGDDSSRMVFSLQYHDELQTGAGINTQLFCTFLDDGSGTIPDALLRGWQTSTGGRRVQAVRWRTALETEGDAMLYLVSTYTVTKTSFP
jgi:hypothetical protein